MNPDVVIVGLGVMGSAAACALAERGRHVVGLDPFAQPHKRGSSHGATRVFRMGYFEGPFYVPLLRRARDLWRELERHEGTALLHRTGIVEIGRPDSTLITGTLAASTAHGLPTRILTAAELGREFPGFRPGPDFIGVVQPEGGYIEAEKAVQTLQRRAQAHGAELRTGAAVRTVAAEAGGVRVETARGDIIHAGTAIVAAGAWVKRLLPDLPVPIRVTREVLAWFEPHDAAPFATAAPFPVFMLESRFGLHYGFPLDRDGLVKIAKHHHRNEAVDPDRYDTAVSADDEALIRAAVAEYLPAAAGPLRHAETCLYTKTPDEHFLIDFAGDPRIVIASPCSGHGFKFAPVIGEILADLAIDGATAHDISHFRLARFTPPG